MLWSVVVRPMAVRSCGYGQEATAYWALPRGYDKAAGEAARVRRAPAAALLPRGRCGEEGDGRQPLAPARGGDRADPGRAAGPTLRRGRGGAGGRALVAGGARRGGAGDGAAARAGAPARPPALQGAGALPGDDRPAAARSRLEAGDVACLRAVDARGGARGRGCGRGRAIRRAGLAARPAGPDRAGARAAPPGSGHARALPRLLLPLRGPQLLVAAARLLARRAAVQTA